MLQNSIQKKYDSVKGIIVPHAGYIFSGLVAASGYNQIDLSQKIENVFILASSHRAYFQGASIYSPGNYITPLGEVETNTDIVEQLNREEEFFSYIPEAHTNEHSLEVQLPFLQYLIGDKLKIVPIVIGTQSIEDCSKIAQALKPYFTNENVFVISTDFSHYPNYEDALYWDSQTADAIVQNSTSLFISSINDKSDDRVKNLSTRACGWTSLLTLLYMTEGDSDYSYHKLLYNNSGDTEYGDKNRVVGYCSFALTGESSSKESKNEFYLSNDEKVKLLSLARETLESYLNGEGLPVYDPEEYPRHLREACGAFVTLNVDHQLRGCVGLFKTDEPLIEVVQEMAVSSAVHDSRFLPVTGEELEKIQIEISVLTPLRKIENINQIELGRHGIYLKKGSQTGTFLPQVAKETNWNLEEFLGHCARDKAGIGWEGWKNAEIYIYEAIVFSEETN